MALISAGRGSQATRRRDRPCLSPKAVAVSAQNVRAGLQPGAGRIFRQVMPVAGENMQSVSFKPCGFSYWKRQKGQIHLGIAIAAYGADRAGQGRKVGHFAQNRGGVIPLRQGVARPVIDKVAQKHQQVGLCLAGFFYQKAQAFNGTVQVPKQQAGTSGGSLTSRWRGVRRSSKYSYFQTLTTVQLV